MDQEHNIEVSDRLLDLIRLTRIELARANRRHPKGSDDGRLAERIEAAEWALFQLTNLAASHGYRELTAYDLHTDDHSEPKRRIVVGLITPSTYAFSDVPEPQSIAADREA